jgi:hypothetical protein
MGEPTARLGSASGASEDSPLALNLRLNPDRPQDVVVNTALTNTAAGWVQVDRLP